MNPMIARLLKIIPEALKWIVNVAPLVYEGVKWTVKTIKELRKKEQPPEQTPAPDKHPDPG